jgi:WD40 repeat protein
MRTITCMLVVALGLVAAGRAAEPKPEKPALTLPGRAVVKIDGKEVGELSGPTSGVAYSPDGKLLASASSSMGGLLKQPYLPATTNVLPSASSAIKLWDARTGKELDVRLHGFEVETLAFSPDGKRLVSACLEEVRPGHPIPRASIIKVWEAASGKELLNLKSHEQRIQCLAISPDGKKLASGSFKASSDVDRPNVKVWDAETGKEIHAFGGMSGEAFCLAFSPDGKRLAVGTRNFADQVKAGGIRGEVGFWDLTTGKQVATWKPHGQYVKALTYSPDGKRLALGANADGGGVNKDAPVKVCDTETGRELLGLPDEGEVLRQAQDLAFSPNGRLLAVRLSEQNKTAVKVWDVATGKLLRTLPVDNADGGVAFSPDGARLAAGDRRGVTVWDIGP